MVDRLTIRAWSWNMVRPKKLIHPPAKPLLAAIPPEVREGWGKNPTSELPRRLEFLCACGPKPSDDLGMMRLMHHRAVRAAWETYVYCAFACGLFAGNRGKELQGRLASRNPDNFRSAMSECLACWFLAGRLGLPVTGNASGRGAKMLDMKTIIDCHDVGVEVKAPHREHPLEGQVWYGHDGDLLVQCLDTANKQFADDVANILILVPQLRIPVAVLRRQLVTALYGEEKITCSIDTRTGGPAGPVNTKFFPDGRLLRRRRPSGAWVKLNGMPGFTRISTVIVIEEQMQEKYPHPFTTLGHKMMEDSGYGAVQDAWNRQLALNNDSDNHCWIDHNVLVAHNPHARQPLESEMFAGFVQFRNLGKGYGWSDGKSL